MERSIHCFVPEYRTGRYELHFGVAAFAGFIWSGQLPLPGRHPAPWPFRKIDRGFTHLQQSIRQLVFKLERAATGYAEALNRYREALANHEGGFVQQIDLSLHLDSVITYLRILADMVAEFAAYLYEPSAQGLRFRSFRSHTESLIHANNMIDPEYSEILRHYTKWFDLLAGTDNKGVRDLLVHRFATFQHPIVTSGPREGEIGADLVTSGTYVEDVHHVLAEVTGGLCVFLDRFVTHHSRRIEAASGWQVMDAARPRAGYVMTYEKYPPSAWLIPVQD